MTLLQATHMDSPRPFWEQTPLDNMTPTQWEQLCDGCGLCCLNKLEDEETGEIYLTRVACNLLDKCSSQCSDYTNRFTRVPDCTQITPEIAKTAPWLPSSCAYRRLAHGKKLLPWHPLISEQPDSVSKAGIAVGNKVIHEAELGENEYADFIVSEESLISVYLEKE